MDTTKTQRTRIGLSPFFQVPATSQAYRDEVLAENEFWSDAQSEWDHGWVLAAGNSDFIQAPATAVITRGSSRKTAPIQQKDFWAEVATEWGFESSFEEDDPWLHQLAA